MDTNVIKQRLEHLINEGLTTKFISNRCGINVGTLYNFRKCNQTLSNEKLQRLNNFINDCEIFLSIGEE